MIKTVCDICGKEMPSSIIAERTAQMIFKVSSNGRTWDICEDCRKSIIELINSKEKGQADGEMASL